MTVELNVNIRYLYRIKKVNFYTKSEYAELDYT